MINNNQNQILQIILKEYNKEYVYYELNLDKYNNHFKDGNLVSYDELTDMIKTLQNKGLNTEINTNKEEWMPIFTKIKYDNLNKKVILKLNPNIDKDILEHIISKESVE